MALIEKRFSEFSLVIQNLNKSRYPFKSDLKYFEELADYSLSFCPESCDYVVDNLTIVLQFMLENESVNEWDVDETRIFKDELKAKIGDTVIEPLLSVLVMKYDTTPETDLEKIPCIDDLNNIIVNFLKYKNLMDDWTIQELTYIVKFTIRMTYVLLPFVPQAIVQLCDFVNENKARFIQDFKFSF